MKLFTTKQIAELDKYTIENEPIADIDLMERASMQISGWLVRKFSTEQRMIFFAGPGNNGGDALAIARQMADLDYKCEVHLLNFGKGLNGSPAINWKRLEEQDKVKLYKLKTINDFPEIHQGDVLLDGLFGSGLTRPLEGLPAAFVQKINESKAIGLLANASRLPTQSRVTTTITGSSQFSHHPNSSRVTTMVSIDIPSGLMGEDNSENIPENIIQADYTLTFQFPKVSFLFAENENYVGDWEVLPIGLHPDGMEKTFSPCHFSEKEEIKVMVPIHSKFTHKGNLGHALLIAGSVGKMGAAILASKAALRAGLGLLTSHVPRMGYSIIQTAVPEAMASVDQHDSMFTEFPDLSLFSAIGIGPGLNQKQNSCRALCNLLEVAKVPLVLDADAINILSKNENRLENLPVNSILTPHPGEFKRLVGPTKNSFERVQRQMQFSKKYKVVLVVKGAHTTISTPEGKVFFNSTGNQGMATAGSGDVLTGIILGLLAQGMPAANAAIAGVYLHGLAGDLVAEDKSEFSLIAGDILEYLGKAFLSVCFPSPKFF